MLRRSTTAIVFSVMLSAPLALLAETNWTQWRGPGRDGKSTEKGLLDQWNESGPPLLWQTDGLGSGYSSLVIANGKAFTLGRVGKAGMLGCARCG
jgi:outer membrane protein assembly factor BamB